MKNVICSLMLLCTASIVNGQSIFEFSNQVKQLEFINPGYNAQSHRNTINLFYANNTPTINDYQGLFLGSIYVPFNQFNTGIGASIIAESNEDHSNTLYLFTTCSKVDINPITSLSLGINVGIANNIKQSIHTDNLQTTDTTLNFYASPGLYFEFKALELGAALRYNSTDSQNMLDRANFTYLFNACYSIKTSNKTVLIPKLIYTFHPNESYLETAIFLQEKDLYELGTSYRTNKTFMLFADFTLFKHLIVGYSYALQFNPKQYFSDGNHEFTTTLRF